MSQKKLHLLMFCVASCTLAACFQTFPLPKAHRHPSMVDRHRQVKKSVAYLCQSNGCNDNGDAPINIISSRRRILFQVATTLSILSTNPSLSFAAAPITSKEADNFQAKLQRLLRPKPPKALRPKLDQDFAVLLMRSSYNALDQLDVVAMDQFQRDFFLIRQAEYEQYVSDLGPGIVQQGYLTDPYYFDFISFAQYATINREIFQDPAVLFSEQQPMQVGEDEPQQFISTVVKRDPSLTNDHLGPTHQKMVASAILDRFDETFGATDARIPKFEPNSRPSADVVLRTISQLTNLFLINGYAWEGKTTISKPAAGDSGDAAGTQFTISLTAPANIWSGQALQVKSRTPGGGGGLINSFPFITAKELVSRMGYTIASSSIKYEGTTESSCFTIR